MTKPLRYLDLAYVLLNFIYIFQLNIAEQIAKYRKLKIDEVIDHDRFNQYTIVHHSSSIEGSTLDEVETRLLLEEGVTPKGKPLQHSLMVRDHYDALKFTLEMANKQVSITTELIQQINAKVLKSTGNVYNTVLGEVDASKGEFRKGNVAAGGSYFVNYDKVISYTERLVTKLQEEMSKSQTIDEQLELSFTAHFDLVTIHPFYDGNGRTSRLLMNFIQQYFKLPLCIVFKEDKADYFRSLQLSRQTENIQLFYDFMRAQYSKHLEREISEFQIMQRGENLSVKPDQRKGRSLFF